VFANSNDLSYEYIICEKYEDNSIDEIRDLMEEMFEEKISFAKEIISASKSDTKIIRLEWSNGDGVTFEDFKVSSSATKEDIQHCINVTLRCGEDECEVFKTMMQREGYFCEYHRSVVEVYDFNECA
jgi:hypothetical protein